MTCGKAFTSFACDLVEDVKRQALLTEVPLADLTIIVIWNGSEFVNDAGPLRPLNETILDSAARLSALCEGVGHSVVVGFSPSWRWSMPADFDAYNIHVRQILSAAGIMTWDGELLQSLLVPYVIRKPDNGKLNHYHVRLPED